MSQDVIGVDPARRPRPFGLRRRAGAALVVLALAGAGVYLAGRSNPPARPAPPAAGQAERPTVPSQQVIVDLAVGTTSAYALIGRCLVTPPGPCSQQLLTSTGDGTWRTTVPDLPAPAGNDGGFSARLVVGDDRPTLVEDDLGLVFPVEGSGYGRLPLTDSGAVDKIPPGTVVEAPDGTVRLLDPAAGWRYRLANQPPVGTVRAVARNEETLVAVGERGSAVVGAVSHGGQRWAAETIRGLRPGPLLLRLAAGRDGGAYLLVGRETYPEVKDEFTELWRYDGRWRNVTPRVRPRSASSLVIGRDGRPLLTEETGGVWRLQPDGTLLRMPDAYLEGLRVKPGYLVTGPSGLLLSQGVDPFDRTALLSSNDGANTWSVFLPV